MSFEFSLTTFSPTGKLLQIEYALKAVNKGKPAIGIRDNMLVHFYALCGQAHGNLAPCLHIPYHFDL